MKELSIEEKAKRYDEAIERAKYYYDEGKTLEYANDIVSDIFPEFKESEDERIRKEMIFYFTEEIPQCSIQEHSDKMREFISWLEKQREQIDIANKEYWRGYNEGKQEILDKYAKLEKQGEQKIDDDDKAILENWEGIVKDNKEKWQLSDWFVEATLSLVQKIEQIGLPKSIVNNNKTMLNACINTLRNVGHSHLAAWLEKQGEQKPANETPYPETLEKAIDLYYNSYGNGEGEFEHLSLEKFRDIVHTFVSDYGQKPAWSEEDVAMLDSAIAFVEHSAFTTIGKGKGGVVAWLKSLKERYIWKPSDEQMEALKGVQEGVFRLGILESLYNDLLKLKG